MVLPFNSLTQVYMYKHGNRKKEWQLDHNTAIPFVSAIVFKYNREKLWGCDYASARLYYMKISNPDNFSLDLSGSPHRSSWTERAFLPKRDNYFQGITFEHCHMAVTMFVSFRLEIK